MKIVMMAVMAALSGCASMTGSTNNAWVINRGEVRLYEPVDAKGYFFESSDIRVSYEPDISDSGVSFSFQNKSKSIIKIIWDESIYMPASGGTDKVFHAGVKIADRSASQPATLIPPNITHTDTVIPISNVNYVTGYNSTGGWQHTPLCGERSFSGSLDDSSCVGKVFGFLITYEKDGKKQNLIFKYKFIGQKKEEKKAS